MKKYRSMSYTITYDHNGGPNRLDDWITKGSESGWELVQVVPLDNARIWVLMSIETAKLDPVNAQEVRP